MKKSKLRLSPVTLLHDGAAYKSYRVAGYIYGRRIRYQSTGRNEALQELTRLQIEAQAAP